MTERKKGAKNVAVQSARSGENEQAQFSENVF